MPATADAPYALVVDDEPFNLGKGQEWLADGELLDPESPAEMFEPTSGRGLFRRAGAWMRKRD